MHPMRDVKPGQKVRNKVTGDTGVVASNAQGEAQFRLSPPVLADPEEAQKQADRLRGTTPSNMQPWGDWEPVVDPALEADPFAAKALS